MYGSCDLSYRTCGPDTCKLGWPINWRQIPEEGARADAGELHDTSALSDNPGIYTDTAAWLVRRRLVEERRGRIGAVDASGSVAAICGLVGLHNKGCILKVSYGRSFLWNGKGDYSVVAPQSNPAAASESNWARNFHPI